MKTFFLIFFIITTGISGILYYTLRKNFLQLKRNKTLFERNILKVFRQLRYGQFETDLNVIDNENLKRAAKMLTEALKDREMMLSEYKLSLTEKNKSLEKLIASEKESQKFKDDFVAALTHDLKTPVIAELNAIKMMLSGSFGEVNYSQRQVLEMMQKSDSDLLELSEMLLQTYKFQNGTPQLQKAKIDIVDFTKETVEEIFPVLVAKNQKYILNTDNEQIFIDADKIQIKRVLHNLLLNASSYGYPNETVEIDIKTSAKAIMISITDKGENISPEDMKLIFEKYYSGIKKFTGLGTGLGLYCANKAVEAHGGTIEVFTEEDNKTTFTVKLPQ